MESSDDEDSQRLQEALDPEFMNNSLLNTNSTKPKTEKTKVPPSLRPKHNEDDQFNLLSITPQFRDYVAKQLSSILDKNLEQRLRNVNNNIVNKKKRKNRIKLFRDSEKYLKLKEKKIPRVIKTKCNDSDSDDTLKFSEAVISSTDVINQTEVKNWSTKTKGKVFHYETGTNGSLTLIS